MFLSGQVDDPLLGSVPNPLSDHNRGYSPRKRAENCRLLSSRIYSRSISDRFDTLHELPN